MLTMNEKSVGGSQIFRRLYVVLLCLLGMWFRRRTIKITALRDRQLVPSRVIQYTIVEIYNLSGLLLCQIKPVLGLQFAL